MGLAWEENTWQAKFLAVFLVSIPFLLAGGYLATAYFIDAKGGELSFNVIALAVLLYVLVSVPRENTKEFLIIMGWPAGMVGGAYTGLKIAIFFEFSRWLASISTLIVSLLGFVAWCFVCSEISKMSVRRNLRKFVDQGAK